MDDPLSEESRRIFPAARDAALRIGHRFLDTSHLLLGLLAADRTRTPALLAALGVEPAALSAAVEARMRPGESLAPDTRLPLTPAVARALDGCVAAARERGAERAAPEHVLIGLVREGKGIAAQVLTAAGVTEERVVEWLERDAASA